MVVSIFVIGIFSLTSCNKGDDSGTIIDKENFATIKNDYQLYKESKPQVMPEGENIVIDGANYDINGVTTDTLGNVTSIIEIDVSKDKLDPTKGTQELKKLVECFVDIDQSGYSQNDYQYIYDCIFDGNSSIQITNETKKATLDKVVENSKNLINNRNSSTDKVLIHKSSGKVTWKVNIEKAGFYNLYLNYFTVSGYSSSIERKLMINGEIPFEGQLRNGGENFFKRLRRCGRPVKPHRGGPSDRGQHGRERQRFGLRGGGKAGVPHQVARPLKRGGGDRGGHHQIGAQLEHLLQQIVGAHHLRGRAARRPDADAVSRDINAAHRRRAVCNVGSREKEGGTHVVLRELHQDARDAAARAVEKQVDGRLVDDLGAKGGHAVHEGDHLIVGQGLAAGGQTIDVVGQQRQLSAKLLKCQ